MDKKSKKELEKKLEKDLKNKLRKKLKKKLKKEISEYPVKVNLNLYLNVEQNPEQIAVGDVDNAAIAIKDSNAIDRATNSAVAQEKSSASDNPHKSAVAQERSNASDNPTYSSVAFEKSKAELGTPLELLEETPVGAPLLIEKVSDSTLKKEGTLLHSDFKDALSAQNPPAFEQQDDMKFTSMKLPIAPLSIREITKRPVGFKLNRIW
ncbi:hypothetical protein P4V41_05330 [Fictibacillus nanhaiensis]|uniref:hypothetical protein n=1 Tax=Fictibacillus nanhaiensis TaxID=742169 RepID=UPI002E1E5292|nr:hypothetical protein [Fictibacillus nanhaiensis]